MKAKVTHSFEGVPDDQVYPVTIAKGAEIVGDLASAAVANGWASEIPDESAEPAKKKARGGKGGK